MDQGKVFFEGLGRKEAFLDQKKLGKPPKLAFFLKGLVDGFCLKMEIFLIVSFYAK